MNREQVIAILGTLKTAYPRFYADMTKQTMLETIDLWTEMFKDDNPMLVTVAVKNLITSFKFPPTIADVKDKMYELSKVETETPVEIWNAIKKAIRRSSYYATEEFEALPEVAKKFVGSPAQLKEWAIASDFNDGVVKGQFLKQIEIIREREKAEKMMLPETREVISKIGMGNPYETKRLNKGEAIF